MAVTRQQVFPKRIQEEQQAIQDIIALIDAELQKAVSQPNEPNNVTVQFSRVAPGGTDLFSSYVLDPVIQHYRAAGWIFEQPGIQTISLGGQNKDIILYFV